MIQRILIKLFNLLINKLCQDKITSLNFSIFYEFISGFNNDTGFIIQPHIYMSQYSGLPEPYRRFHQSLF